MVGGNLEKFPEKYEQVNISEKRIMDRSDGSESDLRSNISSSSRDERRRVLLDRDDNYGTRFINKGENGAVVDSSIVERLDRPEDFEVLKMYNEDENGLQRSEHMIDFRNGERNRVEGFRRARRMDVEVTRYATLSYSDEGPSSNQLKSNYVYEVQGKNKNEMIEFKDRVSPSVEMVDLDRGTLHRGSYVGSENRYPGRTLGMEMYSEDESRSQRSRVEGFRRARRMDVEGMRYASYMYSEEEPLDNKSSFNYDYGDPVRNKPILNELDKLKDQADLLRKLDELKDQLSRSDDKAKEKVPLDRMTIHRDNRSDRVMESRNGERSQLKEFSRGWRMDVDGTRYAASMYSKEGSSGNWLSRSNYDYEGRMKNKNDVDGFNKVYYNGEDRAALLSKLDELTDQLSRSGEMFPLDRRAIHQDPCVGSEKWFSDTSLEMQFLHPDKQYGRRPYPNRYAEAEPSTMMHRQEKGGLGFCPPRGPRQVPTPFRQPPSHAYFPGEYMARMKPYPPNVSHHHPSCSCFHCHNKRRVSPQVPPTAISNERLSDIPENSAFNRYKNSSSIDDSRTTIPPPLKSQNPQSQRRLPSDLNSKVDDFIHSRPTRSRPASRRQSCRPVAGGAPFLTCYNCFEVLQLPKKVTAEDRRENRMRCGACSKIIALAVSDKKLLLINVEKENTLAEVDDSHVVSEPQNSYVHRHLNQASDSTTFSSYDYDNSGYDFQSMDREPGSLSMGQASSNKSAEMNNPHSTSSRASAAGITPSSEGDEAMPSKNKAEQSSMKSTSAATEIDISTNEYSNNGTSLESGEGSREGDRIRGNTAAESYYAGIMKKISMHSNESSQPVQQERSNVTVNGHLIPERSIKKAERLAGPIHPGHYWYDIRAGFWGVEGGPCLGVIPPYILEFNYPISKNCSGGDTTVFVNGRELHKKDLNLLGSRGLPTDRDRSYTVEISGRIIDDNSGQELEKLQNLAPTVEKANRGFGMRAPKVAV